MKEFDSFAGFALKLGAIALEGRAVQHELLESIGVAIETHAKRKIGEYQDEAGPFEAWAPLANSTKADRVAQGYPEDEPELRSGEMRESIERSVSSSSVEVGSDSDIALYQELGTEKMPPRSFLGGSLFELAPKIVEKTGETVFLSLMGDRTKIIIEP